MTTLQPVLISPSSNVAAFLSHDRLTVSILNDFGVNKEIPIGRFIQMYPDFSVVNVATEEDAKNELARRSENAMCLDMFLFLFDAELPIDIPREISEELEPLLETVDNQHYALDILLSKPLPKSADTDAP